MRRVSRICGAVTKIPTFVSEPQKERKNSLNEYAKKLCLRISQICWKTQTYSSKNLNKPHQENFKGINAKTQLNSENKGKFLKVDRKKEYITCQRNINSDDGRYLIWYHRYQRKWHGIFQVLKEKKCQLQILYPTK